MKNKKQGFTLVEIMIVVAIIGLLAAIGIPSILNAYSSSQERAMTRNLADIEKAKGMLQLPSSVYANGKSYTNTQAVIEAELVACMQGVTALSDLKINNVTPTPNAIGTVATY